MTARVALYCRVSTSTKDQTTENQLRELRSYCDRMEYEMVKVYEDEVSGAKSKEKRPAYSKLCKDAFQIIVSFLPIRSRSTNLTQ
jgi:DNA invertase Pin-like site-specific DNA recombinase